MSEKKLYYYNAHPWEVLPPPTKPNSIFVCVSEFSFDNLLDIDLIVAPPIFESMQIGQKGDFGICAKYILENGIFLSRDDTDAPEDMKESERRKGRRIFTLEYMGKKMWIYEEFLSLIGLK